MPNFIHKELKIKSKYTVKLIFSKKTLPIIWYIVIFFYFLALDYLLKYGDPVQNIIMHASAPKVIAEY